MAEGFTLSMSAKPKTATSTATTLLASYHTAQLP
jgi:hypothetical protein